jgi:TRAP-type C4-dicarboxylate transport system permease small subunit
MSEAASRQAARLLSILQRAEQVLAIVAFLVLVGVVFADVVSRELTGAGLYWASQAGVWANVIVVMAGFGLASSAGANLRPRFTDNWLPHSWEPVLLTLQYAVMALFCLAIGVLAALVVQDSWRLGEVSIDLFLPVWPIQLFMPLAFVVAALRNGLYAALPELRPVEGSALTEFTGGDSR